MKNCGPVFRGVSLDVRLKLSGEAIEFKYCTTAGGERGGSEWSGTLTIRVDTNGELCLNQYARDFTDFEEISRIFLERSF